MASDVEVDKATVNEIKTYLMGKLSQKYGYCGVAEGDSKIMLNSGKTNIIIRIELRE